MQHVFIIGSKGIPGAYGGYETFVDKLTEYHQGHGELCYHIACKDRKTYETRYHNARCFHIRVPDVGPAQAIYYDVAALKHCCRYIRSAGIRDAIVYILACRIGPFMAHYTKKLHALGAKVYVNPDGHEWLRAKWSAPVRRYWKRSEAQMVKYADLLVCDSKHIESYIRHAYGCDKTCFIPYGAETQPSALADDDPRLLSWYAEKDLAPGDYYLVVGRFVPENNYETMLREFMASSTPKKLALITDVSYGFLKELKEKTGFDKDSRIRFVGTVYDAQLLRKLRENAFGYFHGHEVGGTNPSLLEALGATPLNLLLDVGFNREVAEDAALYWNKEPGSLARLIALCDEMDAESISARSQRAKARIDGYYSWAAIAEAYGELFLK